MRKDGVFRKPLAWLEDRNPALHEWLTTDEKPKPAIREAVAAVAGILLLVTILWGATGQPLTTSPVVVVESGSMMRCDQGLHSNTPSGACDGPFGRLGTIDPGDLVFVHDVDGRSDVTTLAACDNADGKQRYGACGDTIIFRRGGSSAATPIIHRAMFWLDIHGDGTYSVPELGLERIEDLNDPSLQRLGLPNNYQQQLEHQGAGPEDSGFITWGDNNVNADQPSLSVLPVHPDWVVGKARGEVPWIGLLKLAVSDFANDCADNRAVACNYSNAPGDLKLLMWITLGALIGGPVVLEMAAKARRRRRQDDVFE